VYVCKLDISDGFYHIPLDVANAPLLTILLPQQPGKPPLLGIPLALPMGWVKSPPYFCAATETVADNANEWLCWSYAPPHPLESLASMPTTPPLDVPPIALMSLTSVVTISPLPAPPTSVTTSPLSGPLGYIDVYMDDFVGLVQANHQCWHMVRHILMQAVEEVFHPPFPIRAASTEGTYLCQKDAARRCLLGDNEDHFGLAHWHHSSDDTPPVTPHDTTSQHI
jgi:hypothetical protein